MLGFAIPAQLNFLSAVSSPNILGLEAFLRLFSEASHIPFLCCTTPSLCLPPEIWSQLVVERLSISSVSRYVKSQG